VDTSLEQRIKTKARSLGFDLVGIAPATPGPHLPAYRDWLAGGYHGEMGYLARPDRLARLQDPTSILPGARSLISVGLNYFPGPLPAEIRNDPARGMISNYAWGADYHELMASRLEELAAFTWACAAGAGVNGEAKGRVRQRVYVDTGPILERDCATAAGLGFYGKNCCLINPQIGSWLFLGEILSAIELACDTIPAHPSCGSCRRCLDACPTRALIAPYLLDSRRCISYLTIELRGAVPRELRPLLGNRVFGCDVCQEVCPWNARFARPTREAPSFEQAAPSLLDLMALDEPAFARRFRDSPVRRAKRRGLLRNVALALGNWGSAEAVPALARALRDPEPLLRGHAAWALGRIGSAAAGRALQQAWLTEENVEVREEIQTALDGAAT
jgi:epoxyqueuosine reductase